MAPASKRRAGSSPLAAANTDMFSADTDPDVHGAACRRLDQRRPAFRCVEVVSEDGEDAPLPVLFYRCVSETCRRRKETLDSGKLCR